MSPYNCIIIKIFDAFTTGPANFASHTYQCTPVPSMSLQSISSLAHEKSLPHTHWGKTSLLCPVWQKFFLKRKPQATFDCAQEKVTQLRFQENYAFVKGFFKDSPAKRNHQRRHSKSSAIYQCSLSLYITNLSANLKRHFRMRTG
ncbi:hypothetical protein JTE90_012559 [Oedothorax gibbosus]|uniref:Uncharacterized protein n=1 Tax=Oedothorax gibbosus TaxID=931172 RepID=A0AAV6TYK9_9ARAC|nr:hypothetical protein JTE90_012559 [Oedothorax gibbosus]